MEFRGIARVTEPRSNGSVEKEAEEKITIETSLGLQRVVCGFFLAWI